MHISIIVALITIMMIGVSTLTSVYGITNSTSNVKPLYRQIEDLIENPFFAPDASCMFDAYQLHCILGGHQECPEGFGRNDDGTCFVSKDGKGCPDGYHSAQDDETGQCYPDTEPCYPGQVRNQSDPTDKSCNDEELGDIPDEYCLTNPDQDKCAVIPGESCPDGFTVMSIANFTLPRCVPENVEELERAERERQVFDSNRCVPGYKLQVTEDVDIHQRGDNIGYCVLID